MSGIAQVPFVTTEIDLHLLCTYCESMLIAHCHDLLLGEKSTQQKYMFCECIAAVNLTADLVIVR